MLSWPPENNTTLPPFPSALPPCAPLPLSHYREFRSPSRIPANLPVVALLWEREPERREPRDHAAVASCAHSACWPTCGSAVDFGPSWLGLNGRESLCSTCLRCTHMYQYNRSPRINKGCGDLRTKKTPPAEASGDRNAFRRRPRDTITRDVIIDSGRFL